MTDAASPYRCMPRDVLADGDYSITAVRPEHIEDIRQWRNAQLDVLRQAAPISPAEQQAYYARVVWPDKASPTPKNILVSFAERGRPIGYGGLVHLAWEHRRGEVSFLLRPDLTAPVERYDALFGCFLGLVRTLAFTDLGLARIFTETFAIRTEHMRTLERCGFIPEGVLRHHVIIDGRPVDSIMHGCLAADAADAAAQPREAR